MRYEVKLITNYAEITAQGNTEQEAIDMALADSVIVRTVAEENAYDVALVMFHAYDNASHVIYATNLGKYYMDTN